jgi:hypothetical protein
MNANEMQIGGEHYKGAQVQHWDFVVRQLQNRYLEGAITKYVLRYKTKGTPLQDLLKARHFVEKLKEVYNEGWATPLGRCRRKPFDFAGFVRNYKLDEQQTSIIASVSEWLGNGSLNLIGEKLDTLVEKQRKQEQQEQAHKAGAGYVNQD